jgi:hypothetical protein
MKGRPPMHLGRNDVGRLTSLLGSEPVSVRSVNIVNELTGVTEGIPSSIAFLQTPDEAFIISFVHQEGFRYFSGEVSRLNAAFPDILSENEVISLGEEIVMLPDVLSIDVWKGLPPLDEDIALCFQTSIGDVSWIEGGDEEFRIGTGREAAEAATAIGAAHRSVIVKIQMTLNWRVSPAHS